VALKMLLPGALPGPEQRKRFEAEAGAVARLNHPNIVQVFEVGEAGGRPYLALEFVEGPTLARRCAGTPQHPAEAVRLVEALARALRAAHEAHIVHRDLKPANVLLTPGGEPKVPDFGLARRLDSAGAAGTQPGVLLGTPSYMAPEQAGGHARQ